MPSLGRVRENSIIRYKEESILCTSKDKLNSYDKQLVYFHSTRLLLGSYPSTRFYQAVWHNAVHYDTVLTLLGSLEVVRIMAYLFLFHYIQSIVQPIIAI